MLRCPRCNSNAVHADDTFASCLMCGETVRDEPTLGEKMASNATPEMSGEDDERIAYGPRVAIEAPADVTARVLGGR